MDKEKAVITVSGKDRKGILAAAATEVAKAGGNIVDVSQSVMDGIFHMAMIIEIDELNVRLVDLQENIVNELPEMQIHVMHEDIFNAMHTI